MQKRQEIGNHYLEAAKRHIIAYSMGMQNSLHSPANNDYRQAAESALNVAGGLGLDVTAQRQKLAELTQAYRRKLSTYG